MRATGLKLERFKIVSSAELRLAPITLLIGGNNAGKSTVLQSLALLAQSVGQREPQTGGPYVDLGGTPLALLHRSSRVGESWSIEVTWEHGSDPHSEISFLCRSTSEPPYFTAEGTVRFDIAGGVTVRAWNSAVGPRMELDSSRLAAALGPAELRSDQRFGHLPTPAQAAPTVDLTDAVLTDPEALSAYARSAAAPYLYDAFAPSPGIARALGAYRYVGPDRHFTHAAYELSESVPSVPLQQRDLANALAYDRDVRRGVDQRCRDIFGFGVSADFAQGRNVDLVATSRDGEVYSLNHMGSGFGQVVWIAVYLELQRRAANGLVPLIGIEEAELHLHPAAQPRVARMLAAYAKAGVQQLLTTQSEHLLIALLQLVTTGELQATDLAVYYMDGGTAERLEVDEHGRLSGGLKGFFEANEDELLAHLEALVHGEDQS